MKTAGTASDATELDNLLSYYTNPLQNERKRTTKIK